MTNSPIGGLSVEASLQQVPKVAVVIPSYRVKKHIIDVIANIGPEVHLIIVVDDMCPQNSGRYVKDSCVDERVNIVFNKENLGVGGATMAGFEVALASNVDFIIKVDGDGQMDARLIPVFIDCLAKGADYAKGNRFFEIESLSSMPKARLIGNVALSFFTKLSTGYWNIFDPNNGFVAINSKVAAALPFEKIARRYFFESDMLFRLGLLRAVVVDVPMDAKYADEVSNLNIFREVPIFFANHTRNFFKRIFYNYFLRDFSLASVELIFGALLLLFGFIFGILNWIGRGEPATAGTVMLAALPIIVGFQLLMGFLNYDIRASSLTPLAPRLLLKQNRLENPRE